MSDNLTFVLIMIVVAGLLLFGELLHWLFRAPRKPQRPIEETPVELSGETFDDRYSIRHLERFFLLLFVWFLALLLLFVQALNPESHVSWNSPALPIVIIGALCVWWTFRRGVLR